MLDHEARYLYIDLDPAWLGRLRDVSSTPLAPLINAQTNPCVSLATRLYREFKHMDDLSPLAIEGLLFELLVETARATRDTPPSEAPSWLQQALDLIHDEFAQAHSLSSIAQTVAIHPAHLARTFKAFTGRTVGEHIRHTRVAFVRRQMIHSDDSLAEIALAAGFSDQSHLSRVFKRITGLTPSQFRDLVHPG